MLFCVTYGHKTISCTEHKRYYKFTAYNQARSRFTALGIKKTKKQCSRNDWNHSIKKYKKTNFSDILLLMYIRDCFSFVICLDNMYRRKRLENSLPVVLVKWYTGETRINNNNDKK